MVTANTLVDIKAYANKLLATNPFLSVRDKKDWQARVFFMESEHVKKLIEILEKNKNGLKEMIVKKFKKDPKEAKNFMVKFKSFKAKSMKKVAEADHAKDANEADQELTANLKDLT